MKNSVTKYYSILFALSFIGTISASAKTWNDAAPMAYGRESNAATLLYNGNVLVTGGYNNPVGHLNSCELYDLATNTWSPPTGPCGPRPAYIYTQPSCLPAFAYTNLDHNDTNCSSVARCFLN